MPAGCKRAILAHKNKGGLVRIIVLLMATLLSQVAYADLFTAQLAYNKGDFEAAARSTASWPNSAMRSPSTIWPSCTSTGKE